jgi:hypothetical protein
VVAQKFDKTPNYFDKRNLKVGVVSVLCIIINLLFRTILNRFAPNPIKSTKMKMKFGAIVVDGRGKIGGHVASKNRGGAYLRTKVTPSNPQTSFQAAARARISTFSQGWRSLLQVQRNSWNSAVSNFTSTDIFGDIKSPSGLNLYVKLNSNLDEIGIAPIVTPPLPEAVEPVLTISATATAGIASFDVGYTPTPVPADTSFIIRATAQVSPGRSFLKNEFRNLAVEPAAATSPAALVAEYNARFGTLVAGQKIGVEIVPVNELTGQKGSPISTTLIVAA